MIIIFDLPLSEPFSLSKAHGAGFERGTVRGGLTAHRSVMLPQVVMGRQGSMGSEKKVMTHPSVKFFATMDDQGRHFLQVCLRPSTTPEHCPRCQPVAPQNPAHPAPTRRLVGGHHQQWPQYFYSLGPGLLDLVIPPPPPPSTSP